MRAPNPTILRYRAHINIGALCLGALGFMMLFDARLRHYGMAVAFMAVMGYAVLTHRIRPRITDYLAHLRAAAEKDPRAAEWLAGVEAEFKNTWGIEDLGGLTDG